MTTTRRALFATLLLLTGAMPLQAGTLEPVAPPSDPASAMYTAQDLYNRLTTGAAGAKRSGSFAEPTAPPGETGHTIDEIMAAMPSADNVLGATSADVVSGRTFWGLRTDGSWGPRAGTMSDLGAVNITPGAASQAIPAGYHNGSGTVAGDAGLIAGNIRSGVSIFGVSGMLTPASGNATADQVLSGRSYSSAAGAGTGTMPDRGAVAITPGPAVQAIPAGYHNGSGAVAGDASLVAGNIKSGVSIFGVSGTVTPASGTATAAQVLTGATFSNAAGAGSGTMPNQGAVTITPGTVNKPIPAGYHNGSGTVVGDVSLIAGNIRSGVSIFGVNGGAAFASGNATASQVLTGATFSNANGAGTGTMPNRGAVAITPGTTVQAIPAGYHNGSGTVAGDANLAAGNIRSGVSIFGVNGGAVLASGNATASQVLTGATFSNANGAGTGTMPNQGAVTITPGTANKPIPAGYHNGSGAVVGDAGLVAGNIKAGVSIYGISGTVQPASGTATAGEVLAGVTFSNATGGATGAMPNQGAVTITPGTANKPIPAGYHNGSGTVAGDTNLDAANIKSGVSIFGVTGSYSTGSTFPIPVLKTGQTTSYLAGDDGALHKGLDPPSTRFTDNGNGTVTDNATGLVWLQNADCFGNSRVWDQAVTVVRSLASGTCSLNDGSTAGDWRLPNVRELESLVDFGAGPPALTTGHPFTAVKSDWYWTSTTVKVRTARAFQVSIESGSVSENLKTSNYFAYIWPVRGGQ